MPGPAPPARIGKFAGGKPALQPVASKSAAKVAAKLDPKPRPVMKPPRGLINR